MVDTFFGGNIYLRGEGLAVGQPAVVATQYNMTVRDVLVKEGEKVAEGTVVANTTSQQVADTRPRLTSDAVIRAGRLADMRICSEVVNATVGKAEHRESVAIEGQNQLNQIYDKGLLPIITRTAAAEQAYNGLKDAESLRAERRALADQITMLNVATEQATWLCPISSIYSMTAACARPSPAPSARSWRTAAWCCGPGIRYWSSSASTGLWWPGFQSDAGID